jgi:hypothetical protein
MKNGKKPSRYFPEFETDCRSQLHKSQIKFENYVTSDESKPVNFDDHLSS